MRLSVSSNLHAEICTGIFFLIREIVNCTKYCTDFRTLYNSQDIRHALFCHFWADDIHLPYFASHNPPIWVMWQCYYCLSSWSNENFFWKSDTQCAFYPCRETPPQQLFEYAKGMAITQLKNYVKPTHIVDENFVLPRVCHFIQVLTCTCMFQFCARLWQYLISHRLINSPCSNLIRTKGHFLVPNWLLFWVKYSQIRFALAMGM